MKDGAITAYRVIASTPDSRINVKKPNEGWDPTRSILRRVGE